MEVVSTTQAPSAIGPYSQAIRSGNTLFCSGQLGIDPISGKLAGEDLQSQADQVFRNIAGLLSSQGLSMESVVKSTVFLADMADFPVVNKIYAGAFGNHKPARSTVQVAGLPLGGKLEIECIAVFE